MLVFLHHLKCEPFCRLEFSIQGHVHALQNKEHDRAVIGRGIRVRARHLCHACQLGIAIAHHIAAMMPIH